ncbi:MAG TPA: hypothetical protein VLZ06_11605 [Solirubrobacteraceae bacterium]|nr:hypothetical protein [Solirubrobacteraceae bacterium]
MGRTARGVAIGAAVALLGAAGVVAGAGARTPKPRAPRISHITASVANKRASITVTINPESLASSYQLALLYRPPNCCRPGTKECCPPEVEVVSTGNLPASSTPREIHESAKLREGNWAVRVRVEAKNSAGSSEKSRALKIPNH